jgi:hypothetical protein
MRLLPERKNGKNGKNVGKMGSDQLFCIGLAASRSGAEKLI